MKILSSLLFLGLASTAQAGARDFVECRFYDQSTAINPAGIRNFTLDNTEELSLEKEHNGKLFQVTYSGSIDCLKMKFCVDQDCSDEIEIDATKGIVILLNPEQRVSCHGFEG